MLKNRYSLFQTYSGGQRLIAMNIRLDAAIWLSPSSTWLRLLIGLSQFRWFITVWILCIFCSLSKGVMAVLALPLIGGHHICREIIYIKTPFCVEWMPFHTSYKHKYNWLRKRACWKYSRKTNFACLVKKAVMKAAETKYYNSQLGFGEQATVSQFGCKCRSSSSS
jgi:hypothetical protein